jgi:gas vesicle protein
VNGNLCGMLIGGAVIAGVSLFAIPAAAESPKDMGGKWGGKCATSGRAAACCKEQRGSDAACKNLEKEKAGSAAVKNCEEAEKVCAAAVRSAEDAKKAEDEKKKKAEDAKKPEENKGAARPLPSARQVADNWQKELTQAEDDYSHAIDDAKNGTNKADIEKALKKADGLKKRIDVLRRRIGDLSPAERISYTSKLPKEYESKNPFDIIYDVISKKVCRKNGKLQWDGSILSCQYGENPSGGDRPIPPATDISPNNPNAR